MKQKLIALLKTLFASKGFNAKELESLADLVIAQGSLTDESTDQDLQTAADAAKPTADFVQSVASRQVSDVKKPKVDDPAPAPVNDPKPVDTPASTDPVILAILGEIKTLSQGLASINGQTVAKTRRESFIEAMKGTSPEYQARELKRFDRITFKDDDDFNSYLEDTKDDHAAAVQDESNQNLGNDRPAGGKGGNANAVKLASDAELDAVMENI